MDQSQKLQHLIDRQDILDCVNRYCRGLDRHDAEMIASAYHDDAIDNHGRRLSDIPTFVDWVNSAHAGQFNCHTHHITNHNCEIDGDTAHVESYVFFVQRTVDGRTLQGGSGRYVDRFEKRDGLWKIALRRLVIDWRFKSDALAWEGPAPGLFPEGRWDSRDLSFQRPLVLDDELLARVVRR
jgi:ketosteroid isomerase-like protein